MELSIANLFTASIKELNHTVTNRVKKFGWVTEKVSLYLTGIHLHL